MKNDQGYTLIELIIVILIMGILTGTAAISIQSLDSGNAKASVSRISALLDYVHVENMSRDKNYYLVIQKQEDSFVAKVQYESGGTRTDIITEKLKLKEGEIKYYSRDLAGDNEYVVDDTATPAVTLELSFAKTSGAFRSDDINGDGTEEDVKRIVITAAGRTNTIVLVTATGKHYME